MALISVKDVALGYDGNTIIENLNFTVESGNYLCIVGENGSGKSTLMKTLLKLKSPLSGEITFGDGLEANMIGYLPQQTVVQRDFPASVEEIVLSGCLNSMSYRPDENQEKPQTFGGKVSAFFKRLGNEIISFRPFYTKKQKALARANMEKMGITQFAKRCYRELSGGQQQRVLLARALCATGKLLLLDEPVAGLDPKVTAEMYSLIEELNKNDGITVIMISHDISAALKYATHILHVGHEPLFFGTKEEYLNSNIGRAFTLIGGGINE